MLWEVARRWACDVLKGAAANNAIGTRDASLGEIVPGLGERGMRLPSELGPGCTRYLLLRRLGRCLLAAAGLKNGSVGARSL
jgi:hypothetical protein